MKGLAVTALVISLVSLFLSASIYIQVGGVARIRSRVENLGFEIKELREETARTLELKALLFEVIEALSRAEEEIRWGGGYSEAASFLERAGAVLGRAEEKARGTERVRIEEIKGEVSLMKELAGRREEGCVKGLQRLGIKVRLLRDNL